VPRALGIKEPVELLLVEGGALLRPVSNGDDVVGAALAFASLGRLGTVAVLVVPGWRIAAWTRRVVAPLAGTIGGIAAILVVIVDTFGVLHVGMLVDDGHHIGDGLGVAFKHLPP
jgi:hypothetical protein